MINIAIDGPCGSGKGAVAGAISKKINICHLDTGAIYRTIGLYYLQQGINPKIEKNVVELLDNVDVQVKYENREQQNYLNGVNVNDKIRSLEVSDISSVTSVYLPVRDKVKEFQQDFAKYNDVVMEGRDITTEILVECKNKYFLTASVNIRAERRFKQHIQKGDNIDFETVYAAIEERDYRDINREHGSLQQASDATLIDSSNLTIDEVVDIILKNIK